MPPLMPAQDIQSAMTTVSERDFIADFEAYLNQVEDGRTICIVDADGRKERTVVLMSEKDYLRMVERAMP